MLLSQKTTIPLQKAESNIIGHMCYAAYKLWNVCNYERRNYKHILCKFLWMEHAGIEPAISCLQNRCHPIATYAPYLICRL